MEIKKEELIKDLLLSNHELLKQIIINNERKCTEPAADYITDVMEKFIKIGTHRTKNIKSTLERSEILNRLEDSNIPAPLPRPIKRL
ncbi:TPA: hypothetical protein ACKQH2_005234, partial [Serratia marcescens]